MNHTRRKWQSAFAYVFLALTSSGGFLSEVSSWSPETKGTRTPVSFSTPVERHDEPLSALMSRRSALSTATIGLVLGEAVLMGNPTLADAAGEASFVYTRKQTVLNKKELNYQIAIPSTMSEGSKPVKTHLDEVNFVSDSVKRYQYGITVDPVRISSLKEVRAYPMEVAFRFCLLI
jgi:hypothetical protein